MEHQDTNENRQLATRDSNDLWKSYKQKSTAITQSDLDQVWQNYPKIEDYRDPKKLIVDIDTMISRMCKVYFGIPEQFISDELIEEVSKEIVKKYKTLTVQEISHAFERIDIQKSDNWKNVTKQEIIGPIMKWSNYKQKIKEDFYKFKVEASKEQERQKEAEKFRLESIELYNECVDNLEWTGTIFMANAIRKDLNAKFDMETKEEIWEIAQERYAQSEEARNDATRRGIKIGMNNIGYSAQRIYSEMLVRRGIENGIKI